MQYNHAEDILIFNLFVILMKKKNTENDTLMIVLINLIHGKKKNGGTLFLDIFSIQS